jgi:exodeoxyribonuclease-1
MRQFHLAPWEERPALARQFEDERYRRLSHRLVFFDRPDLLGDDYHRGALDELRRRLVSSLEAKSRWRSIPAAQWEMNTLVERGIDGAALAPQRRYAAYLYRRRLELLAPNFNPLAAAMVA